MPCRCPPSPLKTAPVEGAITVRQHDQMPPEYGGARAGSWPGNGYTIDVQRDWWGRLSPAARAAVKAHEIAHEVTACGVVCRHNGGTPCEACADRGAGALLRSWGYTKARAASAFGELNLSRRLAHVDAASGWDLL